MGILGTIAGMFQRPPRTLGDLQTAGAVTVVDRSEIPGTFIARVQDGRGEVEYLLRGDRDDPAAEVVDWA